MKTVLRLEAPHALLVGPLGGKDCTPAGKLDAAPWLIKKRQ